MMAHLQNAEAAGQQMLNDTTIARVSVKIPTFWEKNPETWFKQLESQFILAGTVQDATRYHYVVGNLDNKYADVVVDVINNPPAEGMYDKIKTELIKRLSASKEQKLRHYSNTRILTTESPPPFCDTCKHWLVKVFQ